MAIRRRCGDCGEVYYGDHKCSKPMQVSQPVDQKPPLAALRESVKAIEALNPSKPAKVRAKAKPAVEQRPVGVPQSREPTWTEDAALPRGEVFARGQVLLDARRRAEAGAQPETSSGSKATLTPAERTRRWREKNPEKHATYMKQYAKDRRAKSAEDRDRARFEELKKRFEGKSDD